MITHSPQKPPEPCPVLPSEGSRAIVRDVAAISNDGDGVCIDVRGLEAPQPLVEIISLLENPDTGDTVLVSHDRDPLLLYPELEERGWLWDRLESPQGEIRLRLTRSSPVGDA